MRGFYRGPQKAWAKHGSPHHSSSTPRFPSWHSDPHNQQNNFKRLQQTPGLQTVVVKNDWNVLKQVFLKVCQEKRWSNPATFLVFVSIFVLTQNDFLCTKWHFQFIKIYPPPPPIRLKVHHALLMGTRISLSQSELPFSLKNGKLVRKWTKQLFIKCNSPKGAWKPRESLWQVTQNTNKALSHTVNWEYKRLSLTHTQGMPGLCSASLPSLAQVSFQLQITPQPKT